MKKLLIPIGVSDFKSIIDDNLFYIDKTLLIKELLDSGSKITLLPRPRRFGKTLNLSMLNYFFSNASPEYPLLFKDLAIAHAGSEYTAKMGTYPVVFISFKDVKCDTFRDCISKLKITLSGVFNSHAYLLKSAEIKEHEKVFFNSVLTENIDCVHLESSLTKLIELLTVYWKKKVVILIDEYDVPIQAGFMYNYYDKAVGFMRSFLTAALKDNPCVEKCMMTGILRVAKESIFSGLNNLDVCTLLSRKYQNYFGFTEEEVLFLFRKKGIEDKMEEVRTWYNGYTFGDVTIYNPWSILNFAEKHMDGLRPYWVNTSDNAIVRQLLSQGSDELKMELEILVRGGILDKPINEDIVYREIESSAKSVWSFLLFSGYLKVVSCRQINKLLFAELKIPNLEVEYVYEQFIRNWFIESINEDKYDLMLKSMLSGDVDTFSRIFRTFVGSSFSYFDVSGKNSEKVYHAFVLGLLVSLSNRYEFRSNRESGYGRYDVMLIPRPVHSGQPAPLHGVILEFKKVDEETNETLETACAAALLQIHEKNYRQELHDRGITDILELGIAFAGKKVLVKKG